MQKLFVTSLILFGFQALAIHDSGLPQLTLDTGSKRPSGITSQMIETLQYEVEESALDMAPGDICFAKVTEPAEVAELFAVWSNTPAHPCKSLKIPQQIAVLLKLGQIVSKTGKVMGPEGGKVEHYYLAREAESDRVVGKIHLTTDYRSGVLRQFGLHTLCGESGGCRLKLSSPGNVLSIEN